MSAEAHPLWSPSPEQVEAARLTAFCRWVEERHDVQLPAYGDLWRWSTTQPESFWRAVWDYFDVRADGDPVAVLGRREMPGAEWFPGTRLSFPEHVFRAKNDDTVAILHASELTSLREMTWGELRDLVARIAAGLARLGVTEGDRVVAYLPNVPEAIAAFLATASLGAVWSSCSPDFGAKSAMDRFAQVEPKVLLTVDGYRYGARITPGSTPSSASGRPCRASPPPCSCPTSRRTPPSRTRGAGMS